MHVKELMSRNVVTVGVSDSCHDAVERMHRHKVRHLPVVGPDGAIVGIVTDRDLRHHLFAPPVFRAIGEVRVDSLLKGAPIRDAMTTPVVTIRPDDDLAKAANLMLEDKVGSLPVVEQGRVVGIITETDLLRRILKDDACCEDVATIIVSYP
jgi:acetoin utilization protein AcuB